MALTTNSKVWNIMFLIFVSLTAFFVILFHFEDLFIVLVVGGILVLVTDRTIIEFNKRFGHKSLWARRMYAITFIVIGFVLFNLLIVGQLQDMGSLIRNSQQEYETGSSTIFSNYGYLFSSPDGGQMFSGEDLKSIGDYIFSFLSSIVSKLSYFVFTGLLVIPLMFRLYFSKKDVMARELIDIFPVKYQECVDLSISDIGKRLRDFFSAKILESIIVGLICCIGFYLAGIKGWFFLGVLAGLLNIVPYIGPIIGAIPAVTVGFIASPATALFAVITVIIAQLVDNLYLIPFMISGKVDVNPLLSILLTLIFADMLGALGMILAIPIYIIYKVVLTEFYNELLKIYHDE
ncbi:AI-2E family transporter [Methanolobus psychrotolerans]|uniref:AI-2E family transporter n=1 Tax=Methanolobus psychrotolerans TaxID=1874706 RepID=UPI001F5D4E97|nr:AI-2E family transporter [Methanolobus psychrotolerans]